MIASTEIIPRLQNIESQFQSETDPIKALLLAKLAILEAGGWIEECIDSIVEDYLQRKNPASKQKILEKLQKMYGFSYSSEFKGIWIQIIGHLCFDKIEYSIPMVCQQLESALNGLKRSRDISAHTYMKITTTIDSPVIVIIKVQQIEKGLNDFVKELNMLPI
ncbi:MAG: hypothetical protein Q8O15_11475 [Rectinemataceae bacterium]|nr:hypothetical protein [Rectinemataceae bacterium]